MLSPPHGDRRPRLHYCHANSHAALRAIPSWAKRAPYEAGHHRVVGAWDCLVTDKQRSLWAFGLV